MNITAETHAILQRLGVDPSNFTAGDLAVRSPLTGEEIARVALHSAEQVTASVARAHQAFLGWRTVPAPVRGELVRLFGEELRGARADLGRLVCIEAGKIPSEGLGEVQEMIDVCDMAVGQSRQLFGRTIATERAGHRMMETWQPMGVVGVISAFNFPVAVWCWNAALALVCGDSVVWKPSEKTPLTALATMSVFRRALARFGNAPDGLAELLIGRREVGELLADDPRVPIVSATGSTRMGRELGPRLARRFARAILELGGNNAGIVCPSADLGLALRAIAFAAMGTAGQRCTTLRRLFVHADVYDRLVPALRRAYASVTVGNPLTSEALVGPLIDRAAFDSHTRALAEAQRLGGVIHGGERVPTGHDEAYYVRPALVEMPVHRGIVLEETFSPITYVMKHSTLEEAVAANNAVAAGLSSSIFTTDVREAEFFMGAAGSDCGIANVNMGTSGAEVGGAFGGEKETGGGRESGSDAWKGYMRRTTNTINYSNELPLAQGVRFELG